MNDLLNVPWFWILVGALILVIGVACFHWIFERTPQNRPGETRW